MIYIIDNYIIFILIIVRDVILYVLYNIAKSILFHNIWMNAKYKFIYIYIYINIYMY